ncbi:MAG: glycosyltransferase family 4 protein [Spirochaetes bacterium]|nr:glycosyltransferase family 4 protein [Spirochaetota bacterium]
MKRILYIVSTLKRCSPVNQLYNVIRYLNREEFEPYLITLSSEPPDSSWKDYESIGVHLYSLQMSRLKGFIRAVKQVNVLLAEIKPDIIHTQGIRGDIISSKLHIGIPKIATVHNLPQFDYPMTYGYIRGNLMRVRHINTLKKISLCIGVSGTVADNLINKYKINKVISIQNGVDTNLYFSSNDNEKKLLRDKLNLCITGNIFISSGHLTERKDPLFLIKAWNKIFNSNDNNHLVFIGTGNLLEKCRKEAGNNKNIHLIGQVNNVVDYLKCSDYFISVSQAEGLPVAVLEAMACGLPVLLSDIEAHKEILTFASGAGYCYKLGNEADFLYFLDKALNANKIVMCNASQEAVKNNFNAKKMSEKYQGAYRQFYTAVTEAV